jgi:hypothetical protein
MRLTRGRQKAEQTENKQPGHARNQTANASGHRRAPAVARPGAEGATHPPPRASHVDRAARVFHPPASQDPQPDVAPRPTAFDGTCHASPADRHDPRRRTQPKPTTASDRQRVRRRPHSHGTTRGSRRRHATASPLLHPPSWRRRSFCPHPEPPHARRRAPCTIGISLGVHASQGRSEAVTQPPVVAAHARVQRLNRAARRLARGLRDGPRGAETRVVPGRLASEAER